MRKGGGRSKRRSLCNNRGHTLPGSVLAPRSRRGSLNRLLVPSMLILRVMTVSGLVVEGVAMAADAAVDVGDGWMGCWR